MSTGSTEIKKVVKKSSNKNKKVSKTQIDEKKNMTAVPSPPPSPPPVDLQPVKVTTIDPPKPLLTQEELLTIKYAYNFILELKNKIAFRPEGEKIKHHDCLFLGQIIQSMINKLNPAAEINIENYKLKQENNLLRTRLEEVTKKYE